MSVDMTIFMLRLLYHMAIPKKIHYVWLGEKPISPTDAGYIAGWQKLNPDYEIRHWTEKDIDLTKYPLVAKAIFEKRWALAADIIRMYAVYTEGGFYLDTDVELLKPLDPLTKYNAVAGWESQFWFTTSFFGAAQHSPWIVKILKRYEVANPNRRITTDTFMKTVHSPSVYAKDIFGLKLDGQTRVYGDNDLAVFAPEYFSPKHYMTGEVHQTPNTIAFHHYASTWHNKTDEAKTKLSAASYRMLGPEKYARLEKEYNKSIERKIRRELP